MKKDVRLIGHTTHEVIARPAAHIDNQYDADEGARSSVASRSDPTSRLGAYLAEPPCPYGRRISNRLEAHVAI